MVENDEYAAFLGRVIDAYSRRVASGDIEAITAMAVLADRLEDATRQAITGLRAGGYSWADIAALLGITRQGAQQRWSTGSAPVTVTTTGSHRTRPELPVTIATGSMLAPAPGTRPAPGTGANTGHPASTSAPTTGWHHGPSSHP